LTQFKNGFVFELFGQIRRQGLIYSLVVKKIKFSFSALNVLYGSSMINELTLLGNSKANLNNYSK